MRIASWKYSPRSGLVQPGGAANLSQPVDLQTNQTSAAVDPVADLSVGINN